MNDETTETKEVADDEIVFGDAWAAAAVRMDTPDMDDVEDSQ